MSIPVYWLTIFIVCLTILHAGDWLARMLTERHRRLIASLTTSWWYDTCGSCGRDNLVDEEPWPEPGICPDCVQVELDAQKGIRNEPG